VCRAPSGLQEPTHTLNEVHFRGRRRLLFLSTYFFFLLFGNPFDTRRKAPLLHLVDTASSCESGISLPRSPLAASPSRSRPDC
jgi:hypothetical protein